MTINTQSKFHKMHMAFVLCCVLFAMVTTALTDLKEMSMGDGNQSSALKRMCVWNSSLLQISVWLHNWSCRCDMNAKTSWNHTYSFPTGPRKTSTHALFLFFLTHNGYFREYNLHHWLRPPQSSGLSPSPAAASVGLHGRQKQRRCWVWAADDKVADFSVPAAEQVVSETENDAMNVTAWVRCQTGHRK